MGAAVHRVVTLFHHKHPVEALRQAAYFFVAGRVHMPRKGEGRFPFRLHLAKLCGVVKAAAQKLCKLL